RGGHNRLQASCRRITLGGRMPDCSVGSRGMRHHRKEYIKDKHTHTHTHTLTHTHTHTHTHKHTHTHTPCSVTKTPSHTHLKNGGLIWKLRVTNTREPQNSL